MTYEQLTQLVADVAERLQTTLKLYYIGNCSSHYDASKPTHYFVNYDDRSWAVCFEDLRDAMDHRHYAPHNVVLGSTDVWANLRPETLLAQLLGRHAQLRRKAA